MTKIFNTPFSATGDLQEVPQDTQPDGSVSYASGFSYDYEKPYEELGSKDIKRETMNQLFHDITEAVGGIQKAGVGEWNKDAAYVKGALSQVDGVIYRAKEAVRGEQPTTSAKWERLLSDKVGTSDFIGMSQSAIKKELDKKINSSGLTQTITADKLKAPSNFAVNTALKKQDPRQWGLGGEGIIITSGGDLFENLKTSPTTHFRLPGGIINSPTGDQWGTGIFSRHITDYGIAFVISRSRQMYLNAMDKSSGWGQWAKVYSDGNTSIDPNGVLTTKQDTVTLTTKDLAKETGNSHSKVMSQKATTDAINNAVIKNTASVAENGWYKDTSTGVIIQWGKSKPSNTTIFPVAYPNMCRSVQTTQVRDGKADNNLCLVSVTRTEFTVNKNNVDNSDFYWISIGY